MSVNSIASNNNNSNMSSLFSRAVSLLIFFIYLVVQQSTIVVPAEASSAICPSKKVVQGRAYVFKAVDAPEKGTPLHGIGVIEFTLVGSGGTVRVNGSLTGLSPGHHGFHVHEVGDIGNACTAAGVHFNPFGKNHGAPTAKQRHVGDLGNIRADASGIAHIDISDTQMTLNGQTTNIIGRAIVIHEMPDDLGLGNNDESKKTGNSGKRVACGIIGVAKEKSL